MLDVKKTLAKILGTFSGALTTQLVTATAKNVSANATTSFSFSVAKEGYTPLGVVAFDVKTGSLIPVSVLFSSSTNWTMWVTNRTTTAVSNVQPTITVLYCKTAMGGVVRKLLNTLKMLTSGRGWVFC